MRGMPAVARDACRLQSSCALRSSSGDAGSRGTFAARRAEAAMPPLQPPEAIFEVRSRDARTPQMAVMLAEAVAQMMRRGDARRGNRRRQRLPRR